MGSSTNNLCIGMAAVYSFFGITLAISPKFFWGPDSALSYWTEMDTSGVWFGRAMGIWMTAITLSPWTAGVSKSALAKVYIVPNVLFLGLFLQASFCLDSTGPGANAALPSLNLWWTQLPIAATFLMWNVQALGEGKKAD